jgi:glucokinase
MTAEDGLAVIGVDLGGTKCHAVLADATGRVLHDDYRPTAERPDPADVVADGLTALRRAAGEEGLRVGAVAVGVPGFVDPRTGLVVGANNLDWGDSYDLGARLTREGAEPFLVENDVNLAALGEARAGAGRGASSFVTVSLGTGLGGAVVVDGAVLRGHHHAAGELGFLLAGREQLRRPGLLGMESLVGGPALAARARVLGFDAADAAAVFAAAADGDPVGEQVVDELLEHLAMAVVDVCAVVDPERVVLDGSVGRSLAPHLSRLAELVRPSLLYPPQLGVSELLPNASLVGAVTEALRLAGHPLGAR